METYSVSIDQNEEWSKRILDYSRLSRIAIEVNAPGNNIFDTQDIKSESQKLKNALIEFTDGVRNAKNELLSHHTKDEIGVYIP